MKGLKTGQVIAALILTPLICYTLWIAAQASTEADDLRNAPPFGTSDRINGQLYRLVGEPSGTLAASEAYPEITDAIQYQVDEQIYQDGEWKDDPAKPLAAAGQDFVRVGPAQVEITPHTLYSWPVQTAYREPQNGKRVRIRWRQILPEQAQQWIVFGTYSQGRLTDGNLQRLLVFTPGSEAKLLDSVQQTGQIKAVTLVGVALILCLLTYFSLRRRNVD